jgi:hypothetical protein
MTEHMKIHDREKVKHDKQQEQKEPLQLPPPPPPPLPQTASSKVYYDQVLDGEVEHHVNIMHLPSHIKIGILQNDRKFHIDGDFIEINYGHEIGMGRDMEHLGIPPTDLQSIQPVDEDDDDEQTGLEEDCESNRNLSMENL